MRNVSGLFCNIRQLASLLTKLGHDTWLFLIYVCGQRRRWRLKISFCANNWPSMKSARLNRGGPLTRLVWRWFGLPIGLTGDRLYVS